jgi:hypothetical protein
LGGGKKSSAGKRIKETRGKLSAANRAGTVHLRVKVQGDLQKLPVQLLHFRHSVVFAFPAVQICFRGPLEPRRRRNAETVVFLGLPAGVILKSVPILAAAPRLDPDRSVPNSSLQNLLKQSHSDPQLFSLNAHYIPPDANHPSVRLRVDCPRLFVKRLADNEYQKWRYTHRERLISYRA